MNFACFSSEWKCLIEYLYKKRWWIVLSCASLLFLYGAWMFNAQPNVDKEVFINTPGSFYNWLDIGRQGLVATEYLFGLRWFNPYISTSVGYLLLCVAGVVFGYVFWRMSAKKSNVCVCFALLYFCAPIFVEQFYFDLQILQIAWAYVLCAIGVGLSFYGILKDSGPSKILATICMIWSFCSYQIFVVIHVSAVILGFLLLYYRWSVCNQRADISNEYYWKLILWLIGLFVFAMAVNTVITRLFFQESVYLSGQEAWGRISNAQCMDNIFRHIWDGFFGNGIFYSMFYGLSALCMMIVVLFDCSRIRGNKLRWMYVLAAIGLQLCPFALTIYMGNAPAIRSQLAYPFVLICNLVFLSNRKWKKIGLALLAVMVAGSVWSQSLMSMRLIYTDNLRAQEDMRLLSSIEYKIQEMDAGNKPIAIIGSYSNRLNPVCVRGEVIGVSIFSFDTSAEPHYFWSTRRVCNLANTIGYSFSYVSAEQMFDARQTALSMSAWPHTNSVRDVGDYVIVKLGEDDWQGDVLAD